MSILVDDKQDLQHVEDGSGIQDDDLRSFEYVSGTVEEKNLVRKIDRHILPMLWLMYVFNYLDRTNIGNAKVGGMEADLKLTSSDYSLVLSIFFVGYLLNEVPSNMILSRSKPSLFLPTIMVLWGSMSIGAKGVTSLGGMVAFRLVLGLVEAGFFPGVMLLLSCWYKPAELSKRIALFYTASLVSGAFGGLLAGGIIGGLEGVGNTRGWKWLFIIEGLCTVCIASVAYFVLPNFPTTTKWLTDEEKRLAVYRLQVGPEQVDDMTHKQAFIEALKDPKTWCFMIIYNVLNSVGTISYFFPTLMKALGYTGRTAQFMTVPIYVVALVVSVTAGWNADRTRQKAYHVLAAACLAVVSFVVCVAVHNNAARYAMICFGGAGVWTAVPLFLSWMVTMFDGREKRAISIALINGVGNLSSVYGSFFWPATDAPQYVMGFSISTGLMALAGVLVFVAKWKINDRGVAGIPQRG
ncbi:major facilitator superfamily transporter [Naematelia encephala]|uniref:Major facilitator superfamily transporter n=1 Tax=Naematelia encephala TaxID=71784 RepID=A0A1Y2AXH7_9TREE|nr:major facilitator superfamily transporter [Naematelia encephala]